MEKEDQQEDNNPGEYNNICLEQEKDMVQEEQHMISSEQQEDRAQEEQNIFSTQQGKKPPKSSDFCIADSQESSPAPIDSHRRISAFDMDDEKEMITEIGADQDCNSNAVVFAVESIVSSALASCKEHEADRLSSACSQSDESEDNFFLDNAQIMEAASPKESNDEIERELPFEDYLAGAESRAERIISLTLDDDMEEGTSPNVPAGQELDATVVKSEDAEERKAENILSQTSETIIDEVPSEALSCAVETVNTVTIESENRLTQSDSRDQMEASEMHDEKSVDLHSSKRDMCELFEDSSVCERCAYFNTNADQEHVMREASYTSDQEDEEQGSSDEEAEMLCLRSRNIPKESAEEIWITQALVCPQPSMADTCHATGQSFMAAGTRMNCPSCGHAYYHSQMTQNIPLPQFERWDSLAVCRTCFAAQILLVHIRQLRAAFAIGQHYKKMPYGVNQWSILQEKEKSPALAAALDLRLQGQITEEDFQEVLRQDVQFRRRKEQEELGDLHCRLIGEPVSSLLRLLLTGSTSHDPTPHQKLSVAEFQLVCSYLSNIARDDINQIDFYWPQVLHTYILFGPAPDFEEMLKVELFEEFIVGVCLGSLLLATRFVWGLLTHIESLSPEYASFSSHNMAGSIAVSPPVRLQRFLLELSHQLEGPIATVRARRKIRRQSGSAIVRPDWARALFIVGGQYQLLKPSACQAVLLKREMMLLQHQRLSLHKLEVVRLQAKLGTLLEGEKLLPCCLSARTRSLAYAGIGFRNQLRFAASLVSLGERVAAVPRAKERLDYARKQLVQKRFVSPNGGFNPVGRASDPVCRVMSLPAHDAYVFNTNERAPLLLVMEVVEETVEKTVYLTKRTTSFENLEEKVDQYISKDGGKKKFIDLLEQAGDEEQDAKTDAHARADAYRTPAEIKTLMSSTPQSTAKQSIKEVVNILRQKPWINLAGVPESSTHPPKENASSEAIMQDAQNLLKQGKISQEEFNELITKDNLFQQNVRDNAYLDVQFWLGLSFGETWNQKRTRIGESSPYGNLPGWTIKSVIVKTNADLRQEVFTLQLIGLCEKIFQEAGLSLWLCAYQMIPTGISAGFVETLTNSISLDALKKKKGFVSLEKHFMDTYARDAADTNEELLKARRAFVTSTAAYSLVCYLFQIKDRHNGNILLDTSGHVIHIDFGFLLGSAPGGAFSIETAPFKLTAEMVTVMEGLHSPLFSEFVNLFVCGYLVLQREMDRIISLVEVMLRGSSFDFLAGRTKEDVMRNLTRRFRRDLTWVETIEFCLGLIKASYNNSNTRRYDDFQRLTQGIMQ